MSVPSESHLRLPYAAFYLNGLNFVLCGGDEHCKLKISQFDFREVANPENSSEMIRYLQYTEHDSMDPRIIPKVVTHQLNKKIRLLLSLQT